MDDATNLSVRATSGVTSSSPSNYLNAGNSLLSNGGLALGFGIGGGGGNTKLSRERKHRMREQATLKLSKAYHLDEIACSVATMQSASTLEDVAQLVLQRNPNDIDAKYVHFFHEKIPSRQMAECTTLQPLDEIISENPSKGEVLRTRAVARMFKNDFAGAAQDLTYALQICRYYQSQHKAEQNKLRASSEATANDQRSSRWKDEIKLDEEDQPSGLETQLLFHRAGVYLTIACQNVDASLPPKVVPDVSKETKLEPIVNNILPLEEEMTLAEREAHQKRLEARKIVKTNAKRALRDYLAYLSHFDYTPGILDETSEEVKQNVEQLSRGPETPSSKDCKNKNFDVESNNSLGNHKLPDSPSRPQFFKQPQILSQGYQNGKIFYTPSPIVHSMSSLFSATPPSHLPPYPNISTALSSKPQIESNQNDNINSMWPKNDFHESLTYHPLLTDALHSLLLCHCLVQTSTRELQRHAYMVSRLARVCDGYPIFQAPRSPSRADWIEVLRRSENWIKLCSSWEALCAPVFLPGHVSKNKSRETLVDKQEHLRQQAIMEALEDDRVHDEASFHAAVTARQRRQKEETGRAESIGNHQRLAQQSIKEYPTSTERAHAIMRWIKEAPHSNHMGTIKNKKGAGKSTEKGKNRANNEKTTEGI